MRTKVNGFCDQAYTLPSKDIAVQRCINLYPDIVEVDNEKEKSTLINTPGLNLHAYLAGSTLYFSPRQNGILNASDGRQYIINGVYLFANEIVGIDNGLTVTQPLATLGGVDLGARVIGIFANMYVNGSWGAGPVSMADNGTIGMLVDNYTYWIWNLGVNFLSVNARAVSDAALTTGSTHIAYMDGRFIMNDKGTNVFRCSCLDWNGITAFDYGAVGLLYASADQSPDKIQGLIVVGRDLWIFGTQSFEIWNDAGLSPFPFARNVSIAGQIGLFAPYSLAQIQNTLFWLGGGVEGSGIIYRSDGYTPVRISTFAVEQAILSYTSIDDAIAFCYQESGHSFYVISFQGADQTWVYDLATNKWHQRLYRDPVTGDFTRWRPVACGGYYGTNFVLDRMTSTISVDTADAPYPVGLLHKLDQNFLTDNGDPIKRIRSSPHVWQNLLRVFYNRVELDMETGVGLENDPGLDPLISLKWSNDGGHNWTMPIYISMGKRGDHSKRVVWRRLGYSRSRVFEISTSAPVPIRIQGMYVDAGLGG